MAGKVQTMSIHYTTRDDGIWIRCPCGWELNAGHSATVADILKHVREHKKCLPPKLTAKLTTRKR
jgi:hypothetical protein